MAKNRVREKATRLRLPVPDGTVSGDALIIGDLPCVAVTDKNHDAGPMPVGQQDGKASVQTDGSWRFTVNGPVVVGEIVHLEPDGDVTTAVVADRRFGYALEPIAGDVDAEIEIKLGY